MVKVEVAVWRLTLSLAHQQQFLNPRGLNKGTSNCALPHEEPALESLAPVCRVVHVHIQ